MEGLNAARCSEHGLVIPPGGVCVLCKRADTDRASRTAARLALVVAGALALACVAVLARRYVLARAVTLMAQAEPAQEDADEEAPAAQPGRREIQRSKRDPKPLPPPQAAASTPGKSSASARAATDKGAEEAARREDASARRRELQMAMHEVPIVMYSTQWCPRCKEAKSWLEANSYSFTEMDVETNEQARRAHRALNPRGTVPTMQVDGEVVIGFGPANLEGRIRRAAERHLL